MDRKRIGFVLILGLVLYLGLTHLPIVYSQFYHLLTDTNEGVNGHYEVREEIIEDGIILDGEWEFYWKHFIVTDESATQQSDMQLSIPGYWSDAILNGKYLPENGFASYRMTIENLEVLEPITLYIPDFGGAYRAYIDGALAAESGTISKLSNDVIATPRSKIYPVTLENNKNHELVIEVANKKFAGLYMAPVLRDYKKANQIFELEKILQFIFFGIIIFAFFIIVLVYSIFLKKGYKSLWLLGLILALLMRLILTTSFYSYWQNSIFFGLSYETINPLMFLVTFVYKFLLIYLFQEQFNMSFSKEEKGVFLLYYTLLYLVYTLIPDGLYNQYFTIIIPLATFAIETYLMIKLYKMRHKIKKYGIITYFAVLLAFAGIVINSYYINGNIYMNMSVAQLVLMAFAIMMIITVQILQLSWQYHELTLASAQFELAGRHIEMQKEYFEGLTEQINKIRSIKHDLHHFIVLMNMLLKEGRLDEMKKVMDEYVEHMEIDAIPVFCEHIVANSIIGYHYLKAKQLGIEFSSRSIIPKDIGIRDNELCIILGNALENAVEAAAYVDEPMLRKVNVEAEVISRQLILKIENGYKVEPICQDGRYHSIKAEDGHGIGLQNIYKAVDSCGGIHKIEYADNRFIHKVALPV